MALMLTNFAISTVSTVLSGDTSISVASASTFPAIGSSGNYFFAVLQDNGGNWEIIKVTGITGATLTVVRAQEGSTAQGFASGSYCYVPFTLQNMRDLARTSVVYDAGTKSSGTWTIDFTQGSIQTWTNGGAHTVAVSNWPTTGNLGELLLIGTNLAAYTITWPSWNWIKPDGTTTTSITTYLSSNGTRVALQTSGVDQILVWTRDAGTTVYAKLI